MELPTSAVRSFAPFARSQGAGKGDFSVRSRGCNGGRGLGLRPAEQEKPTDRKSQKFTAVKIVHGEASTLGLPRGLPVESQKTLNRSNTSRNGDSFGLVAAASSFAFPRQGLDSMKDVP